MVLAEAAIKTYFRLNFVIYFSFFDILTACFALAVTQDCEERLSVQQFTQVSSYHECFQAASALLLRSPSYLSHQLQVI